MKGMNVNRDIKFWEEVLKEYRPIINISAAVFIEDTIQKLKWLERLEPKSNEIENA